MPSHQPSDPAFEERVRRSFASQKVMALLGARLERVAPGEVEIRLPFRDDLTQQHGFFHAGLMTTVADSACAGGLSGDPAKELVGAAVNTTPPARPR